MLVQVDATDYSTPTSSITSTSQSLTRNRLGASYPIFVDITVRQKILDGGRFEISFLNNIFYFDQQYCLSTGKTSAPVIQALFEGTYSCSVDMYTNKVTVRLFRSVNQNEMFRFQLGIRNPNYVYEGEQIQVKTMLLYANTIVEVATSSPVLTVQRLTIPVHRMQLAWGLEYSPTSQSFYPFNLLVLRSESITPVYYPYNSFRWIFQISDDIPEEVFIQVEISIPNKMNSFVLAGSISHTLPNRVGLTVDCHLSSLTD